jgi:hypothetical protein
MKLRKKIWHINLRFANVRTSLICVGAYGNVHMAAIYLRRPDVRGGWREVQSEELHSRYSSENIIRRSKSRRTRYTGPL